MGCGASTGNPSHPLKNKLQEGDPKSKGGTAGGKQPQEGRSEAEASAGNMSADQQRNHFSVSAAPGAPEVFFSRFVIEGKTLLYSVRGTDQGEIHIASTDVGYAYWEAIKPAQEVQQELMQLDITAPMYLSLIQESLKNGTFRLKAERASLRMFFPAPPELQPQGQQQALGIVFTLRAVLDEVKRSRSIRAFVFALFDANMLLSQQLEEAQTELDIGNGGRFAGLNSSLENLHQEQQAAGERASAQAAKEREERAAEQQRRERELQAQKEQDEREEEERRRQREAEQQKPQQQQQQFGGRKRVAYGGGQRKQEQQAPAKGQAQRRGVVEEEEEDEEEEEEFIHPPLPEGHGEPVIPKDHEAHEHYRQSLAVHKSRSRTASDIPTEVSETLEKEEDPKAVSSASSSNGASRRPSSSNHGEGTSGLNAKQSSAKLLLPLEKCVQIIRTMEDKYKMPEEDRNDMEYVIEVLTSDDLYTPDMSSMAAKASNEEAEQEEVLKYMTENVMSGRRAVKQGGGLKLMKGVMHVVRFARALRNRAHKKLARRILPSAAEELKPVLETLNRWDFDVFQLNSFTGRPLYYTALSIIHKYHLVEKLNLNEEKLRNFLNEVEKGYRPNPYHNNVHAADVTQTCFFMLNAGELDKSMLDLDLLAAVVACCSHDYDHPGYNNNFQIRTESETALLYNDQSVLEMHHCTLAFRVMQREHCNFTEDWDWDTKKTFRDLVISSILATDMAKHFDFVGRFKSRFMNKEFDSNDREDVQTALQILIKASDVSNPAKPPSLYKIWADRLMEEFYQQGDRERELQLPISAFMDRTKPCKKQCQLGFMNFIVKPLFETIVNFNSNLHEPLDYLLKNKAEWENTADPKPPSPSSS